MHTHQVIIFFYFRFKDFKDAIDGLRKRYEHEKSYLSAKGYSEFKSENKVTWRNNVVCNHMEGKITKIF